ncbi:SIS domain-containing protein [Paracoccus xiamenensis]|uniref:SIS domain-containing protein n=1 Tax=Paracoccus xiamenensis TaxID=2714901 RepID=UPI00140B763C|nr:SIS domain-containing protein [Paracoccus xiamenensis]NHF74460.1 SIS domain-containing protein [Paracoccus xiamenensis]
MTLTDEYFDQIAQRLSAARQTTSEASARAVQAIVEAARNDGRVYVFGTGHSHVMAEEVHYRAGGLAVTVPVLAGPIMVHEGAVAGTVYERTTGIAAPILERYGIGSNDVMIVVSNSGINAAPVEAARFGKAAGAVVIALTSIAYSTAAAAAADGRTRIADIADIVLDNGSPPGDAVLSVPGSELKVAPVSTVIGAVILNAIFAEVSAALAQDGDAPIYRSANMPGASEHNARLVSKYRARNPHL